MNIVIVDDSRLARKELLGLLQQHPAHQVLGEAANVAEAVARIDELQPDLLLLDIHLPDGNGFDVLEQVEFIPKVVFTTAYEQHALKAFEVNALDYLLKPVSAERLAQALDKAAQVERTAAPPSASKQSLGEHLFIRDGERCHFVKFHEITSLEVDGNYVKVYFRDTRAMLGRSLNYVEERLDPQVFFRANRQQIVNLNCIAHIEPWVGEGLMIKLRDGKQVEVSRRQARELKQRLEI